MYEDSIRILEDEDVTLLEDNHQFIQKKSEYRFSIDPVILVDFFENLKNTKNKKILDIGTGNGIIPVLLNIKNKGYNIDAVEIIERSAKLARKNMLINEISSHVNVINMDIKDYKAGNTYDYVVSNPPYMEIDGKLLNENKEKSIARHEIALTLDEFISLAKRFLKPGGSLYFVHRTYRLPQIINILTKYNFNIKRAKFVFYSMENDSNLVLIEALKNKKSIFIVEKPLFLGEK
ncbi:MAG: methyltransferase [Fusobacteriaceae bacterium]|jgi:16S rRNA (guanine1207-N2)-methyltransferase|nr:methyltransferase [Fusobacteriaceae bacterium]